MTARWSLLATDATTWMEEKRCGSETYTLSSMLPPLVGWCTTCVRPVRSTMSWSGSWFRSPASTMVATGWSRVISPTHASMWSRRQGTMMARVCSTCYIWLRIITWNWNDLHMKTCDLVASLMSRPWHHETKLFVRVPVSDCRCMVFVRWLICGCREP